jgi:hypothetical protein
MATVISKSTSWKKDSDALIRLIADRLADRGLNDDLPGLKSLLDDYLDDNIEVTKEEFHQRMLRVFRMSSKAMTYQDLLGEMTDDERDRVEKFVADEEPIDKCCDGFDLRFSLDVREHLRTTLDTNLVTISAAGPVLVAGLSNDELKLKDSVLHTFVHGLSALFCCANSVIEDKFLLEDEVIILIPEFHT